MNQRDDRIVYLRSHQQKRARRWTRRTTHAFDHSPRGLLLSSKEIGMLGTSVSRYIIVNTLPLNSEKDGRRGGEFSDNLSIRWPISIPFFAGVSALPLG